MPGFLAERYIINGSSPIDGGGSPACISARDGCTHHLGPEIQTENQGPVVYHYDYDWQDKTGTLAEEQHCNPDMEYHFGYNYCDVHPHLSYQDNGDKSVPTQPSNHTQ